MKQHYILFFFFSALLISCKSNEKKENDKSIFKYNEKSGITSLDPAAARSFENIWAVNQLFNGLVQMSDSLSVKPCIAKSWEISKDGLIYTFQLRSDVYFHDNELFEGGKGRRVIADDFVHSFFRLFDARVSSATTLLTNIDRTEKGNYKGFDAPNDSTFVIYLQRPFIPFLGILTMKYFSVVPTEVIEYYGDDFRSHPVGTGPFKFKMWEEGSKLVMIKNEHYFEKDGEQRLPYLDAVSVSFIKDKETTFLEFMKGNLDMISGSDEINLDEVFTKNGQINETYSGKFYAQTQPFLKTDYLGFLVDEKFEGVKNSPIKSRAIRQAINYGFDRVKMVKYLRGNLGTPATAGFIPPGLPSYDDKKVKGYEYNPTKARQYLKEAGFPDGKGLPEIDLHTTEQYLDLCEFIQSQLAEIGIKIKIEVNKAAILSEGVASSSISFFRKSWIADYPDAENFLSLFYSSNFSPMGFNYTHYKNEQFDNLYSKAKFEVNDSIRYGYYQQMDQLLMDDAPVVPLYYDQVIRLVKNNISGLSANPMNMLTLKRVKKQKN